MDSFNVYVKSNVDETQSVAMILFSEEGQVDQETLAVISSMSRDQATIYCSEHGWKLIECPPVANVPLDKQSVEKEDKKKDNKATSKRKKLIISAFVGIVLVAIIGLLSSKSFFADYDKNLELATIAMLSGAADAETAGTLIHDVWYNCIHEKSSTTTDKYTKKQLSTGIYTMDIFYSDFNDALNNLFSDQEFEERLLSIRDSQDAVAQLMKKLKNPSSKNKEAYEAIKELYSQYTALTNMVLSPSGSLQSFTADFNAVDSGFTNAYYTMELYLAE